MSNPNADSSSKRAGTANGSHPSEELPVQRWYGVTAIACVGLGLVFGAQVWQDLSAGRQESLNVGALFFMGLSLAVAGWQWRAARTRITLESDRVRVAVPWSTPRTIEFRQMLSVVQEGRVNPALLILYHPHTDRHSEGGLLDLDAVQSLSLPAVENQQALLERLEGQIPA